MPTCNTAWNIFLRWKRRNEEGEDLRGVTNEIALSALAHIAECPLCLVRWEVFMQTFRPPKLDPWASLLPFLARATGIPPEEISRDTPLGSIQIANIIMLLHRVKRCRVKCFPDKMTVGKLIARWATSS